MKFPRSKKCDCISYQIFDLNKQESEDTLRNSQPPIKILTDKLLTS